MKEGGGRRNYELRIKNNLRIQDSGVGNQDEAGIALRWVGN
jgi:hypothetical protein